MNLYEPEDVYMVRCSGCGEWIDKRTSNQADDDKGNLFDLCEKCYIEHTIGEKHEQ